MTQSTAGLPGAPTAPPQAAAGSLAALYAGSQALPGGAQSLAKPAQPQSTLPQAGLLLIVAALVRLAGYTSAVVLDVPTLDKFQSKMEIYT